MSRQISSNTFNAEYQPQTQVHTMSIPYPTHSAFLHEGGLQDLELSALDHEDCCICMLPYYSIPTPPSPETYSPLFDPFGLMNEDSDSYPAEECVFEEPVQLPCGHIFGSSCIIKWSAESKTCPYCRVQLFELYDHELNEMVQNNYIFQYGLSMNAAGQGALPMVGHESVHRDRFYLGSGWGGSASWQQYNGVDDVADIRSDDEVMDIEDDEDMEIGIDSSDPVRYTPATFLSNAPDDILISRQDSVNHAYNSHSLEAGIGTVTQPTADLINNVRVFSSPSGSILESPLITPDSDPQNLNPLESLENTCYTTDSHGNRPPTALPSSEHSDFELELNRQLEDADRSFWELTKLHKSWMTELVQEVTKSPFSVLGKRKAESGHPVSGKRVRLYSSSQI